MTRPVPTMTKPRGAALATVALLASALLVAIPAESGAGILACDGQPVTIQGTLGDDVLVGTAGPDVIHGLDGNDVIQGLDGDDTLCGGTGDDLIEGGNGNDKIRGGDNADTLRGGDGADELLGGLGNDSLFGGLGADTLVGGGDDDELYGSYGADFLDGFPGNDYLAGGGGPDVLAGGYGDDLLTGKGGDDVMNGGAGEDVVVGNVGNDTADGGLKRDRCAAETETSCEANPIDYRFERFLINQAVPQADSDQAANDRVGTVENRAGIVRAFVSANQADVPSPVVRLHWRVNGVEGSAIMDGPATVPTAPLESNLATTYNYSFDETLLAPGAEMYVSVDATDITLEGNEYNNRYPKSNWADLDTHDVPQMRITVVPITIEGGAAADISLTEATALLQKTLALHPVGAYDIIVRQNYLFENPSGTTQDWITLVNEMASLQQAEDPSRQYHAFLPEPLSPGIGGIGFIGFPAAVSLQNPEIIAHETGHNLDLPHVTCSGQEANPDPNYPYPGGKIGTWGYNIQTGEMYNPDVYVDIMTYCAPEWISDYNFANVLDFRANDPFGWQGANATPVGTGDGTVVAFSGSVPSNAAQAAMQENLLGSEASAELTKVEVVDRAANPPVPGDHLLVGVDADGATVLSVPFRTYALDHADGAWFFFSIELSDEALNAVAEWRVEHAGHTLASRPASRK